MKVSIELMVSIVVTAVVVLACGSPGDDVVAEVPGGERLQSAESGGSTTPTGLPPLSELLKNGREPFEGVITGGQPSQRQLERAASLGVSTVINLRMPQESGGKREDVEALGMRYVSIPVDGADGLTVENARALAEALETSELPVIVHCGSGNRVGALFAIKAKELDGMSAEESLAIGQSAGVTRLEGVVRNLLGLGN